MYAKLWQESSKAQIQMGKANILPPRANWYSAMRKGDFFVELEFGPSVLHRQHFRTKLQAEKFIEQFQKTKNKQGVTASEVQKKVQEQESDFAKIQAQAIQDQLAKDPKNRQALALVQQVLDDFAIHGGKLGKHQIGRAHV